VNSGGFLRGSGTVGNITLNGGAVYPGGTQTNAATLSASSLLWNDGFLVFDLELSGLNDLLDLSGALTKGSGTTQTVIANFVAPGTSSVYTLANFSSTDFTAGQIGLGFISTLAGQDYKLQLNGTNLQLVATPPVPPPPVCPTSLENPATDPAADFEVCGIVPAAQSGNATVNSLLFNNSSSLVIGSEVSATSGAVESKSGATSSIVGGTLTAPSGLAFNTTDGAIQKVSSTISGGAGFVLIKLGSGTLALTGDNTYAGSTFIKEGTLEAAASNALGSSRVTVQINANLNVTHASILGANLITNNGSVNFLDQTSAGQTNITNSGSLNFSASSTAGSSTLTNASGSQLTFMDQATAGNAAFTNQYAKIFFNGSSSATAATIANEAGSELTFANQSNAGSSVITNRFGVVRFKDSASANAAVITSDSAILTFSAPL
jgi:autotransporter-associated beta strand protein